MECSSTRLCLPLLLVAYSAVKAAVDQTIVPNASGEDLVDTVTELIEMKCIFNQNDNILLKRIANAETEYGTSGDLSQGGIWQLTEDRFNLLYNAQVTDLLADEISRMQTALGVDWGTLQYSDLTVPLYSGLAAHLWIAYVWEYKPGSITDINGNSLNDMPVSMKDQADLYANYYLLPLIGTYSYFIQSNTNNSGVYECKNAGPDLMWVVDGSASVTP